MTATLQERFTFTQGDGSEVVIDNPNADQFLGQLWNMASAEADKQRAARSSGEIVECNITSILPAPENDKLYRPIIDTDPEIIALTESIEQNGQREPIVLSLDYRILSGHRRFMACKLAGLRSVNVRFEKVSYATQRDEFVKLLREFNRQRVKSLDEQIRESIIDADPDEAERELVLHRREKSKVGHVPLSMGNRRERKTISKAKSDFVKAIIKTLYDNTEFWPYSDRRLHYGLLNNPPLKHASKPDSRYQNDQASYKSLVELLTRMRLAGLIPMDAIGDETRPVTMWDVHREAGAFIGQELDEFLKGYYRNLVQSQPNHIEVLVEKNTVAGIIRPVCRDFTLPMTSGRGYCSLPPRNDMATRFEESGKSKLVVLMVTDFDPDGEEIAASFARSVRDDFNIVNIHPIKVALNGDQIKKYKLPPFMEAKAGSKRSAGFVDKHGKNVWELEALPSATLAQIVREAIVSVLDMDLFEKEQQAERDDAVRLKAVRENVQEALKGMKFQSGDLS